MRAEHQPHFIHHRGLSCELVIRGDDRETEVQFPITLARSFDMPDYSTYMTFGKLKRGQVGANLVKHRNTLTMLGIALKPPRR